MPIPTNVKHRAPEPRNLGDQVAGHGFAPKGWQAPAPDYAYKSNLQPVSASPEFKRIAALPERAVIRPGTPDSEALEYLMREWFGRDNPACQCKSMGRECITSLRSVQAWALFELRARGGLLGAIGVGFGKSGLDLLAPLAVPDCKVAVLLVPPGLVSQLIREYELFRQHWRVPSLISHAKSSHYNARVQGAPVLHIFPYSMLSRPDATNWLTNVRPDLIIADEAHRVRHPDTATTARVLRYFAENPACRFASWTGSLTDSSLHDYGHLAALALRAASPLPRDHETLDEWASAISTEKRDDEMRPPGVLMKFCEPGDHVREGFRRRLQATVGVVTTVDASVDVHMTIATRDPGDVPPVIRQMLVDLRNSWCRPDGEELIDALAVSRCARELACGLFYRWKFPRGEPVELIQEWLLIRAAWNKSVRAKLLQRLEHLDSPNLCQLAAMRAHGDLPTIHGKPEWRAEFWPAWRDIKDKVKPETEAIRVDDYLVQDAAKWASDNKGVVWYEVSDFGQWVAEVSGMPRHGGGPGAPAALAQERGDRSILCSIKSHGTGRDGLQRIFHRQLVAQPPSSASLFEQLLGRLHRQGQTNAVDTWFYKHTPELEAYVGQALRRARYVQATLGGQQKIITYGMETETNDRAADKADMNAALLDF